MFGRLEQEAEERASEIVRENKEAREKRKEARKQNPVPAPVTISNVSAANVPNHRYRSGAYELSQEPDIGDAHGPWGGVRYKATSPILSCGLEGYKAEVLLDTGAEVNAMSEEQADYYRLNVRSLPHNLQRQQLQGVGEGQINFTGIAFVEVSTGGFSILTPVIICSGLHCARPILGMPFLIQAKAVVTNLDDGLVKVRLFNPRAPQIYVDTVCTRGWKWQREEERNGIPSFRIEAVNKEESGESEYEDACASALESLSESKSEGLKE
jgi:hypothetical protein